MAEALIANAVANLMMRARRARRGSHSYAIQSPSSVEESMGSARSPSVRLGGPPLERLPLRSCLLTRVLS